MDAYHEALSYFVFGLAGLTFVALLVVDAPYGRHGRTGWGPTMNAKAAWVLMESPTVFLFTAVYLAGCHRAELVPLLLLATWQLHYIHRTFVFPTRMPASAKRMPLLVVLMGFSFQLLNTWLNARWISELGSYDVAWLADPRFIGGALVFVTGMWINMRSDYSLLALKKKSEGYVVPRGGLFDYVTSPNYFGELLEWVGFALMAWSLPAFGFAVFTFANLAPRALAHRRWYRERFAEYPRSRRALIPFIL